jgi:hypothetical protein
MTKATTVASTCWSGNAQEKRKGVMGACSGVVATV